MDDSVFRRLALTAYEAATDATRWHVLLEDLRATFEATTVSIFTPVVGANQRLLAAASGMDPGAQALIANWVPHDPWLKTRLDQGLSMNTGLTVIGSEYLPWSQLERTDFFQECGRRVGVKGLISLVIEGDQGQYGVPRTHLALSREPTLPEFGDHHAKFLRALGKPLRAALQSYFALEQLQTISDTLEDCFEAIPQPLFVLGVDQELLYANRAGTALLRQGVVATAVNGCVSNVGNLSGGGLEHVSSAAASRVGRAVPFWWISDGDVHTGVLHVGSFSPLSAIRDRWSAARVVLLLELDEAPRRKAARLTALARLYQLTPAEVRVLVRLSEGMRPESVATVESLSVATVRTHIAHLLQKTGAIGTFDLIRLLVG
jgi:DNA-binding CsgD family transcriptional regulator